MKVSLQANNGVFENENELYQCKFNILKLNDEDTN